MTIGVYFSGLNALKSENKLVPRTSSSAESGYYDLTLNPSTALEREAQMNLFKTAPDNQVTGLQISVIMPTYNQAAFFMRAINSLKAQTFTQWELLIINDGSTDNTRLLIDSIEHDERIRTLYLPENRGLGFALNCGLTAARTSLISYLPSDDLYFENHLESLKRCLDENDNAPLAFSGVRFHSHREARGQIPHFPLQLVQVMHRRSSQRWIEREELVTDDLDLLFWKDLKLKGAFQETGHVSCEWVDHPHQHHKAIRENMGGGINPYRMRYGVKNPIRFHSSVGSRNDEAALYKRFRERPDTLLAAGGLKILIVGELAFNPERVLALEERGHRLFGLWMNDPWWLNTVGPLPFGHVTEIDRSNWRSDVRKIKPDIIYALLNWQAVPFVHEVLQANLGIPIVWHIKEGPWLCLQHGTWPLLVDLHTKTDGQIYTSPELKDWFNMVLPEGINHNRTMVLDGDLPKKEWFEGTPTTRLSVADGEFHTVVPGRPIGLHPALLKELPEQKIHLHFYGDLQHGDWGPWVDEARRVAPGYLHLHSHVGPERWLSELSRYDGGWLHFLKSNNNGSLRAAYWDDLNIPCRTTTLMAAGLPLLQYDNAGAVVATQNLVRQHGIGLFCKDMEGLGCQLRQTDQMDAMRLRVNQSRPLFTFDHHADELIAFFHRVISERGQRSD